MGGLEPGSLIGRYRLVRFVETTVTGACFEAVPAVEGGGDRVLLKVGNKQHQQLFFAERNIAMALDHPNIQRAIDGGQAEGWAYLVLEHVDGVTYLALLEALRQRRAPVPVVAAMWIAHRMLLALEHVHQARDPQGNPLGLVHRTITPRCVLLSRRGEVKLTSFGGALAAGMEQRSFAAMLLSDLAYVAPEQLLGQEVDPRADLFSTALVLYEALTGVPADDRVEHRKLIDLVLDSSLPSPAEQGLGTSKELGELVMKALAKQPEDRFASAATFAEALAAQLTPKCGGDLGAVALQVARLVAEVAGPAETDGKPATRSAEPAREPGSGTGREQRPPPVREARPPIPAPQRWPTPEPPPEPAPAKAPPRPPELPRREPPVLVEPRAPRAEAAAREVEPPTIPEPPMSVPEAPVSEAPVPEAAPPEAPAPERTGEAERPAGVSPAREPRSTAPYGTLSYMAKRPQPPQAAEPPAEERHSTAPMGTTPRASGLEAPEVPSKTEVLVIDDGTQATVGATPPPPTAEAQPLDGPPTTVDPEELKETEIMAIDEEVRAKLDAAATRVSEDVEAGRATIQVQGPVAPAASVPSPAEDVEAGRATLIEGLSPVAAQPAPARAEQVAGPSPQYTEVLLVDDEGAVPRSRAFHEAATQMLEDRAAQAEPVSEAPVEVVVPVGPSVTGSGSRSRTALVRGLTAHIRGMFFRWPPTRGTLIALAVASVLGLGVGVAARLIRGPQRVALEPGQTVWHGSWQVRFEGAGLHRSGTDRYLQVSLRARHPRLSHSPSRAMMELLQGEEVVSPRFVGVARGESESEAVWRYLYPAPARPPERLILRFTPPDGPSVLLSLPLRTR